MNNPLLAIDSLINFSLINKLAFLTFIVTTMLGTGLSLTVKQILEPLRNVRLVIFSLVANFVLVPLFVYLLLQIMPLSESVKIGFTILAVAAGPPALPKLAQIVNGNIAFSTGLMMLLMCGTIIYMPIVLPLVLQNVHVSAWDIAKPLIFVMLAPLLIGLLIFSRYEAIANIIRPIMLQVSSITLILGLVISLILQFNNLIYLVRSGAIIASLAFITVSFGLGYFLGGSEQDIQRVLAVGTAQRNIAAALLVGGSNFDDPNIISVIVVTSLSMITIILLAKPKFAGVTSPTPIASDVL
ncbi:sodium:proton symporter [Calothrix sp. HK-06]|nr:sodium:proton symporter [Calothrix sp. HK-06]